MKYWELFENKAKIKLTQKESMNRLNKCRVALKHQGTRPSKLDVEVLRVNTTNFFEENTPLIFGIDFFNISMIELIKCKKAKIGIKNAKRFSENNELDNALNDIGNAYLAIMNKYGKKIEYLYCNLPFISLDIDKNKLNEELLDLTKNVENKFNIILDSIQKLNEAFIFWMLGLNYQKFNKFVKIAPPIHRSGGGKYSRMTTVYDWSPKLKRKDLTKENIKFCINFLIELSLNLERFEFVEF